MILFWNIFSMRHVDGHQQRIFPAGSHTVIVLRVASYARVLSGTLLLNGDGYLVPPRRQAVGKFQTTHPFFELK